PEADVRHEDGTIRPRGRPVCADRGEQGYPHVDGRVGSPYPRHHVRVQEALPETDGRQASPGHGTSGESAGGGLQKRPRRTGIPTPATPPLRLEPKDRI